MNDAKLIAGLKKGDHDSYEALFRMYYGKFVSFVDCIIKDRDAAKDIVQEAFMKVYSRRESLREDLSIDNILYVIVKRLMLNFFRSHREHESLSGKADQGFMPDALGVEDVVIANEYMSTVQSVVARMPAQRQKVYLLSRRQGLSNKEIAERMGLSIRTVDRHISLALSQIRENFSRRSLIPAAGMC